MKKIKLIFLAATLFCSIASLAQQIDLKGVVTVQNSRISTGKIQYVKGTEVEHINANNAKANDVTGDDGKFSLKIRGTQPNSQTKITVIPHGMYSDYMVVNERELHDITLGRLTPVSVYICKKGELEQRRGEMVNINMKKYRDQIKRLQTELDNLKENYDYDNPKYKTLETQIDSLSKIEKDMYLRIKEWAESLTTINLDDANEKYVKAYSCFANGYLDSVSFYLTDEWLEIQEKQLLQQQEEGTRKVEAGQMLIDAGQRDMEMVKAGFSSIAESWLLKAKAMAMENNYNQAIGYYEKAISIDSLNVVNILEFANYLRSIREYIKAEKQYLLCLEIYKKLGKEDPKTMAVILNSLAILHLEINEYQKALTEFEEALAICKQLVQDNPKMYLPDVAMTLNNLANLHKSTNEYPKALGEYEEALTIYRKLAQENAETYLPDVAMILNNLGNLHFTVKEYSKSLEKYEEALEIRRKLVKGNPKMYLPYLATTLSNLGTLHSTLKEYPKALEEYEEALKIGRGLVLENPKAYLPDMAMTLNNLGILYRTTKEYSKASKDFEEALEIYKKLAQETPKAYLSYVAATLNNLANLHKDTKELTKALEEYGEALEIYKKLADENPQTFLNNVIRTLDNISRTYSQLKDFPAAIKYVNASIDLLKQLNNKRALARNYNSLAWYHLFIKEYAQAEQFARQALETNNFIFAKINIAHALLCQNQFSKAEKIYKELSQTIYRGNETYTKTLLEDLKELEEANVFPEERKNDVEKIKKMLSGE